MLCRRKNLLILILLIFVFIFDSAYVKAESKIEVMIDGNEVNLLPSPRILDGRIVVPLRGIFEKMNAEVNWDDKNNLIQIVKDNFDIKLSPGDMKAMKNNEYINLDVPAQIIGDFTYVPLRFVSEALESKVKWIGENNRVEILTIDINQVSNIDELEIALKFHDFVVDVLSKKQKKIHYWINKNDMLQYADNLDIGMYTVGIYNMKNKEIVEVAKTLLEIRGMKIDETFLEMIYLANEAPGKYHSKKYGNVTLNFFGTANSNVVAIHSGEDLIYEE